jgi:hypothetical protein
MNEDIEEFSRAYGQMVESLLGHRTTPDEYRENARQLLEGISMIKAVSAGLGAESSAFWLACDLW